MKRCIKNGADSDNSGFNFFCDYGSFRSGGNSSVEETQSRADGARGACVSPKEAGDANHGRADDTCRYCRDCRRLYEGLSEDYAYSICDSRVWNYWIFG